MQARISDEWRQAFRDWSHMARLVAALRCQADDAKGGTSPAQVVSLRLLERELERKRIEMNNCLTAIKARAGYPPEAEPGDADAANRLARPLRLSLAAEPVRGGFVWSLVALYRDNSVAVLDRGTEVFETAAQARASGLALVPADLLGDA